MLGLSDQDGRDLRTGAMRAKGAQWASIIFWASVVPRLIGYVLGTAAIIAVVWVILHVWDATVGPWLTSGGPLPLGVAIFGLIMLGYGVRSLFRPRGHYRRGRQ